MTNIEKPKPTDFVRSRGTKTLDLPTLAVTKRSKGSSGASKHETAYNIDSVEKLVSVFEERERFLKR